MRASFKISQHFKILHLPNKTKVVKLQLKFTVQPRKKMLMIFFHQL